MAPMPAVALGYRVPDPAADLHVYLATVLLAEMLSDGDASRLQRSLVQSKRLVTDVSAYLGHVRRSAGGTRPDPVQHHRALLRPAPPPRR